MASEVTNLPIEPQPEPETEDVIWHSHQQLSFTSTPQKGDLSNVPTSYIIVVLHWQLMKESLDKMKENNWNKA